MSEKIPEFWLALQPNCPSCGGGPFTLIIDEFLDGSRVEKLLCNACGAQQPQHRYVFPRDFKVCL